MKKSYCLISYIVTFLWAVAAYITFNPDRANNWFSLLSFQLFGLLTPLVNEHPSNWRLPKTLQGMKRTRLFVGLLMFYGMLFACKNLAPFLTFSLRFMILVFLMGLYFLIYRLSLPNFTFWKGNSQT